MLIKARKFGKTTIYRRGYGYLLKLEQIMEDYGVLKDILENMTKKTPVGIVQKEVLKYALKHFTDVKCPGLLIRFKHRQALLLLYEVMKFNNPPLTVASGEKQTAQKLNIDDLSVFIYDTIIEAGYPYTPEEAMQNIDYPTFVQIKKDMEKRKYEHYKTMLLIQHNPEAALELLDAGQGIEVVSDWRDA